MSHLNTEQESERHDQAYPYFLFVFPASQSGYPANHCQKPYLQKLHLNPSDGDLGAEEVSYPCPDLGCGFAVQIEVHIPIDSDDYPYSEECS